MGFLDKLKHAIMGTRELADDTKDAAARAGRTVDDSAEKAKRAADNSAEKVKSESERAVDNSAEKVKRAGNKAENAVDDTDTASDELKKD